MINDLLKLSNITTLKYQMHNQMMMMMVVDKIGMREMIHLKYTIFSIHVYSWTVDEQTH